MSIHGFVDQNGQIQKYDYNDLENIPDTIGEEIVLVQDVRPIEENNKIWLPLTQSSNTVEVPTMDEFNALAEEVQSGGLSEAAKEALLTLLQHVAYIDEHGQDYYDDLEEALAGGTQYTITNNLTGCTTSNSSTKIVEGRTYTATITASPGYTLTGATSTATMGGQTVTGFYNNGQISIPNVTGNLVITVTASSSVASISAVFTQGSAIIYDTDSLDTLRQYLAVTATYADSTTATVMDYALSGTLDVGTSTITVSYGGKTDTFSVTVTSGYVQDGLVAYWDGINNTGSGHDSSVTIWADLANGYDLTKVGSASSWGTDSLQLDGTKSNGYSRATKWQYSENATIEVVLKPTSTGTQSITRFDIDSSMSANYNLRCFTLYSDNTIGFIGASDTTYSSPVASHTSIRKLVAVYSGFTVSKALANNTVLSKSIYTHSLRESAYRENIYIGSNLSSAANSQYPYVGEIYAIRVYNRALTDAEITHNYNYDSARFSFGE